VDSADTLLHYTGILAFMLVSLSVHESAHAWTAEKLGDPTGRLLGRVTLNPLAHLDLFLSVLLPIATYAALRVPFGAAKPVPVNVHNLGSPRRDWMLVALAGPISNLLLAAGTTAVWWGLRTTGAIDPKNPGQWIFKIGILLNVGLAVFNLIPIPALDGSRVVGYLLPRRLADPWYSLDRYGFLIVLGLIVLPNVFPDVDVLRWLIRHGVDPIVEILKSASGLPIERPQ
jgi:Zn-dependent protease